MRGGVVLYAAQENPQIDTATAEKGRFRMKTSYQRQSVFGVLRNSRSRLLTCSGWVIRVA